MQSKDIMHEVCVLVKNIYATHRLNWEKGKCPDALVALLQLFCKPSTQSDVYLVRWLPPPTDWVELNVDGASRGNPGASGCGGVIRGQHGTFVAGFGHYIGSQKSVFAEATAVL